jgi:hypothetical protein
MTRHADALRRQLDFAISHGDHAAALMLAPRLRRAQHEVDFKPGCPLCGSEYHLLCNREPWSELEKRYAAGDR